MLKVDDSQLAVLLEELSALSEHRRFAEALHLAENARRLVPNNLEPILAHARLLLAVGDVRACEASLRGRSDLDSLILDADAASRVGLNVRAASASRILLQSFSVDSLADLRALLGSPLQRPPPLDLVGWVTLQGNSLQGEVGLNWSPRSAVTLVIGSGPGAKRVRVEPTHSGRTGCTRAVPA